MSNVEVGVTHQIKIGREDAWVKIGINLDVLPNEEVTTTVDRASEIANEKIVEVIEEVVRTVNGYSTQRKVRK